MKRGLFYRPSLRSVENPYKSFVYMGGKRQQQSGQTTAHWRLAAGNASGSPFKSNNERLLISTMCTGDIEPSPSRCTSHLLCSRKENNSIQIMYIAREPPSAIPRPGNWTRSPTTMSCQTPTCPGTFRSLKIPKERASCH